MVPQHLERDTPTRSHLTACRIHRLENTVRAVFLVYDSMYLLRNPRATAFRVVLSKLDSAVRPVVDAIVEEVVVVVVVVVIVGGAVICCGSYCILESDEEMKLYTKYTG